MFADLIEVNNIKTIIWDDMNLSLGWQGCIFWAESGTWCNQVLHLLKCSKFSYLWIKLCPPFPHHCVGIQVNPALSFPASFPGSQHSVSCVCWWKVSITHHFMETILPLAKCFVCQACHRIFLLSVVSVFSVLSQGGTGCPKEAILTWSSDKGLGPGVPLGVVHTLEDRAL